MLLKYTRAAGQRVLSPLEWSSNLMGEGRKEGLAIVMVCGNCQELLRTKDLC